MRLDEAEALGERHLGYEIDRDVDGIMSTLVDEPRFELHPNGFVLTGTPAVAEFYRRTVGFLSALIPTARVRARATRQVVGDGSGVRVESIAEVAARYSEAGPPEAQLHWTAVVTYGETAMLGERFYFDRRMAEIYDELLGGDFAGVAGVARLP